jgi:hypothetical protein
MSRLAAIARVEENAIRTLPQNGRHSVDYPAHGIARAGVGTTCRHIHTVATSVCFDEADTISSTLT